MAFLSLADTLSTLSSSFALLDSLSSSESSLSPCHYHRLRYLQMIHFRCHFE